MKSTFWALLCMIPALFQPLAHSQILDRDHWGPKFSTPGIELRAVELNRTKLEGHTVVLYNLFVSGAPEDQQFQLWTWPVGQDPQPAADALISSDGKLVSQIAAPARGLPEDPINLKVMGGIAEPKRFGLVSADGRTRAFVSVIPFPLEKRVAPCALSMEMEAPNYSAVLFRANGFKPNEPLKVEAHSENEGGTRAQTATEKGEYSALIFPTTKGKSSGSATFKVSGNDCSVQMTYPWGQNSYQVQ